MGVYLTGEEVCTRLKVSQSTLYRLCRTGQLKAIKLAAQWRVSEDALAEFVRRAVGSEPKAEAKAD